MEISQQDAVHIKEKIAEGINQGLTDREIAEHIVDAVGSDLHIQLGRVPKAEDLIGIIRIAMTDRTQHDRLDLVKRWAATATRQGVPEDDADPNLDADTRAALAVPYVPGGLDPNYRELTPERIKEFVAEHGPITAIDHSPDEKMLEHVRLAGQSVADAMGEVLIKQLLAEGLTAKQAEIIAAARAGYGGTDRGDLLGWPESLAEARAHTSGDSLADFLVLEIRDVTMGEDEPVAASVRAMEAARNQIDGVLQELYKLAD